MFSHESSSWILLVAAPLGFALYVLVLLGVLWLATRVVRHAWYWRTSVSPHRTDVDREPALPE
jgi:hypothetical protein